MSDDILYIRFEDDIVEVEISDDSIPVEITDDIIEVEITVVDESLNVDITDDIIDVNIEDVIIEVVIDDCCIVTGGGSDQHERQFDHANVDLEAGDLVYQDILIPNQVNKAEDNLSTTPVMGIVKQVLSPTLAVVFLWGEIGAVNSLTPGVKVYVSPFGHLTTIQPSSGYVQTVGSIIDGDYLLFKPEQIRVKLME
jgi:hypothetical protein